MQRITSVRQCVLAGAAALLLCASAFADQAKPMRTGSTPGCVHRFDWFKHTQVTIDELKGNLNLAPEQIAAWGIWSGGVLQDARQQLEAEKDLRERREGGAKLPADATMPEQMARGIERMRAEIDWMQQHLLRLEAAQTRTKAFYQVLDTNQRTIFDMFWHEMYHRSFGHDDGRGEDGHGDFGSCRMNGEQDGPPDSVGRI